MVDMVDTATRSRMMAAIKSINTKPEMVVRRSLHAQGFRFRLHAKALPGKPDLVLRRYRAVVFVHGCFWHGHECRSFKWPVTRSKFWHEKIKGNMSRDLCVKEKLLAANWRVGVVWECSLSGNMAKTAETMRVLTDWLKSEEQEVEIGE